MNRRLFCGLYLNKDWLCSMVVVDFNINSWAAIEDCKQITVFPVNEAANKGISFFVI